MTLGPGILSISSTQLTLEKFMFSEAGVEAFITAVTAKPAIAPISGNILFMSGVINPSVRGLILRLSIAFDTAQVCICET